MICPDCRVFHERGIEVLEQEDGSTHIVLNKEQKKRWQSFVSEQMSEVARQDSGEDVDADDVLSAAHVELILEMVPMIGTVEIIPSIRGNGKRKCLLSEED